MRRLGCSLCRRPVQQVSVDGAAFGCELSPDLVGPTREQFHLGGGINVGGISGVDIGLGARGGSGGVKIAPYISSGS